MFYEVFIYVIGVERVRCWGRRPEALHQRPSLVPSHALSSTGFEKMQVEGLPASSDAVNLRMH
jgi:hypothetical protein